MDLNFIKISNALFDVTLLSIVSLYENTITHIFYGKELVDSLRDEPFFVHKSPNVIFPLIGLIIFLIIFFSQCLKENSNKVKSFSLHFTVFISINMGLSLVK